MQLWKYASGRKFFKLRITHPVGARELSSILCHKHREDELDGVEALPDYSRVAIWKLAREQLAQNADAPNNTSSSNVPHEAEGGPYARRLPKRGHPAG